jgi:hypothetical protein
MQALEKENQQLKNKMLQMEQAGSTNGRTIKGCRNQISNVQVCVNPIWILQIKQN